MMFLGQSISLTYRNHTNILMRISSIDSQDSDPSVLLNGHFDTPPGSPGAGDCGSCVASLLELARLTVDSGWLPPRPIIFLFNGAEELFMLGSHGFMTTHRWRDTVGAFINVEASGTGGFGKSLDFLCIQIEKDLNHHKMQLLMANYPPRFFCELSPLLIFSSICQSTDLVCQSGPGSWPSYVYAQSADVFGSILGDTDYRMFAKDYGHLLEKRSPGFTHYPICYLPPYAAFIALANWEFILFFQCLLRLYQRNWLMKQDSGEHLGYILSDFASAVDEIKSVYSYSAQEKELSKEDEQINDAQHAGLVNVEKKSEQKDTESDDDMGDMSHSPETKLFGNVSEHPIGGNATDIIEKEAVVPLPSNNKARLEHREVEVYDLI
ncbi:hypothetical protein ACS0TY_009113 [Phlomoides rotata]